MEGENVVHQIVLKLLHLSLIPLAAQELAPCREQVFERNDILIRMSGKSPQVAPPRRSLLPILERIKQAYLLWRSIHNHFPKKSRHTLGRKVDIAFIEILESVFVAGYLPKDKKLPFVQKAAQKMDVLKFFVLIAWEAKDIDTKKYALLSEPLDDISRMLNGWIRNIESRTSSAAQ